MESNIQLNIDVNDSGAFTTLKQAIDLLSQMGEEGKAAAETITKIMAQAAASIENAEKSTARAVKTTARHRSELKKTQQTVREYSRALIENLGLNKEQEQTLIKISNVASNVFVFLGDKVRQFGKTTADVFRAIGKDIGVGLALETKGQITSITEAFASRWPKITKIVQTASKGIKTALIGTGIGAIILLVTSLVATFNSFVKTSNEAGEGLSKLTQVINVFNAILGQLSKRYKDLVGTYVELITGQISLSEAFKRLSGAVTTFADDTREAVKVLNQLSLAGKEAAKLEATLARNIATTKDELNKQREIASDNTKSFAQRQAALQKAAELESKLEKDRTASLEARKKEAELELKAAQQSGKEQSESLKKIADLENEILLAQADANARSRNDLQTKNELLREQSEKVKELRENYKALRKEIEDLVREQDEQLMTEEERLAAQEISINKQIALLEKQAREAARLANIPFDETPFVRAREQAALITDRENKLLISERQRQLAELQLAQDEAIAAGISASIDKQLDLEESRAMLILEAQETYLKAQIQAQEASFEALGKLVTDEQRAELERTKQQLNAIAVERKKIEEGARERRLSEGKSAIELEAELASLELELQTKSGDSLLTLEQDIAKKRLEIQRKSIADRIALLEAEGAENSPEVQVLRKQLSIIDKTLNEPKAKNIRNGLKNLLKINDEELTEIEQAAGIAVNSIGNLIATATQAAAEQNQRIIDGLNERIRITEQRLQEELALQEQGYANSAELYKQQLKTLNDERDKAAKEQLERERKIANAQLLINAATQTSDYISTAIGYFKESTKLGPVLGIITALAAVATLAATIASVRNNAKKFAEPPKFREGGWIDGASHAFGGRKVEVEGGEFVVNREAAQKNKAILEAINNGKLDLMNFGKDMPNNNNLLPLLRKLNEDREIIVQMQSGIDYERMEQMFTRAQEQSTNKVINYLQKWPKKQINSNGDTVLFWEDGNDKKVQVLKKVANVDLNE
jgi:hypothetical protein